MKKLLSVATFLVVIITSSFASTDPVAADKKVSEAFGKYFAAAQSVTWNKSDKISTASFQINGEYLSAHFATDATMLGVSRNITTNDLPLNLRKDLSSYFEKYWITNAFEYATPISDSYYITIENADTKLILKGESGTFSIYKKTNKAS
jgi:hypothetical protein